MPATSAALRCAASTLPKNRFPVSAARCCAPVRQRALPTSAAALDRGTRCLVLLGTPCANDAARWGSLPSPAQLQLLSLDRLSHFWGQVQRTPKTPHVRA